MRNNKEGEMPEKLDRCVKKVMQKGYTKSQAYAI